ncbi:hypothetical protein MCAP1_000588 [Malassezia caprae]|uniref:Mitochondrial phosphate carrier protein n=1 Tax=Malassezia caprae TaxID=1381934 RepID=A0AAF0E557_9BASI|nr:hypothetical protein MCAP1_000588 [Malassezia caprae]
MSDTRLTPSFSLANYAQFFAAGGLCATLMHGGLTPIDVVKTRLQLEPAGSKATMVSMARNIVARDGPGGLLAGFGPTAVGYLIQGGAKFCGYEFFKKQSIDFLGNEAQVREYRQLIYLGSASAAEVIATTLLTPLEAARIRLVSERGYARGLVGALTRLWSEGGLGGFYAGYVPILFKQVPYAVGQFYTNEMMHNLVNHTVSPEMLQKAGKTGEIAVQLGCGLTAGVAAAVLSHPADTLLSKINKGGGGHGSAIKKLWVLAKEAGPSGIWAGLPTRILMTAILVSGQFLIYEQTKAAFGAPKSIEIH